MNNYSPQIERIKKKFEQAKAIDSEFKVFGASSHQYKLGQTVTQKEVDDFEAKYGVKLPECYKAFITEFCGSGVLNRTIKFPQMLPKPSIPGPYYGLFSFENILDEALNEDYELAINKPCRIFPYMSDKDWEDAKAIEEFRDIDEDGEYSYFMVTGIVPLGSQGCHYEFALVLNGDYQGKVIYTDESYYDSPFFTYEDNFLDWYERWLDEIIDGTLLQKNVFGFATTMKEDETELFQKLLNEPDEKVQNYILESIGKFDTLSDASINILLQYFDSPNQSIYYQVIGLLTKHRYTLIKDELQRMIYRSEESCQVACHHLSFYARKHLGEWIDIVLKRLSTIEEKETSSEIMSLLYFAKYDYSKDILPLKEKKQFRALVIEANQAMNQESIAYQGVSIAHRIYRNIKKIFRK